MHCPAQSHSFSIRIMYYTRSIPKPPLIPSTPLSTLPTPSSQPFSFLLTLQVQTEFQGRTAIYNGSPDGGAMEWASSIRHPYLNRPRPSSPRHLKRPRHKLNTGRPAEQLYYQGLDLAEKIENQGKELKMMGNSASLPPRPELINKARS